MMKKLPLIFTLVLLIFASQTTAQEKTEWTRIESEKKEVSLSIPSSFLVNAESENYRKKIVIIGFYKDVEMKFSISKPDNPKQYLKGIGLSDDSDLLGNSFQMNGLDGKNLVSNRPKYYSNTIYLASNDYLYQISIAAKTNSKKEIVQHQSVARFINSIKVKGQQLIVPEKQNAESDDKVVSASSLKTSPEVLEALERKPDKSDVKLNYFPASAWQPEKNSDDFERRAIILLRPLPNVRNNELSEVGSRKVTVQVTYLADG